MFSSGTDLLAAIWSFVENISKIIVFSSVTDKLAALWPFLGIVAEVIVLCVIIFIYEKKRSREMEDEADGGDEVV